MGANGNCVRTRVKRLFCLGAHCDDIEIGGGGTILNLAKANPEIEVKWVVFGGENAERVEEARRSAEVFLASTSNKSTELPAHFIHAGPDIRQCSWLKATGLANCLTGISRTMISTP